MLKSRNLIVSISVVLVTSIISFIIRYLIMFYGGIDLFNVVNNPAISFTFCFGINFFRLSFKTFLEECLDYHYMNPASDGNIGINYTSEEGASTGGASTSGGNLGGASTSGGNLGDTNPDGTNRLRVGRFNGPIQVVDPMNQISQYNPLGVNQPLLGNIARELTHQKNLGHTTLNKYTFSPDQEKFVLTFLLYNHRDVYDRIMSCELGQFNNVDKAKW
jgi:hypothetical protein